MEEDRKRWNKRFSERNLTPPRTPGFVSTYLDHLAPGTVLDVASGDGAVSLFLAKKGFEVTACDISDVALQRLADFAERQDLRIKIVRDDLDSPQVLPALPQFDNILIAHFKPKNQSWNLFSSLLKPGGSLIISTFNLQHHHAKNFSRRFCLEHNELTNISDSLQLVHYESVVRDGDHMDDYIFRKNQFD